MAGEGYAVIRDALRKTGKVGLGQLTISGREWLVAVAPLEDGLVMEMLRYADEPQRSCPVLRRGTEREAAEGDDRSRGAARR
jgi:non-homologous end joining protein Ku